jgi:DNA-binding CsgD family transcriptional regulator
MASNHRTARTVVAAEPPRDAKKHRVVVVCSGQALASGLERALGDRVEVVHLRSPQGPRAEAALKARFSALVLDTRGVLDRAALGRLVARARKKNPGATAVFAVSKERQLELPGAGRLDAIGPGQIARALADRLKVRLVGKESAPFEEESDPLDRWVDLTSVTWGGRYDLTAAECAIVKHAIRGRSNKEIAAALGVSVATVRTHLLNIGRKVGISSRGELIFRFFGESWALVADERQPRSAPKRADRGSRGRRRWRVLFISENSLLRGLALAALDDAESVEPIVLHEAGARQVMSLGLIVHGVVVDHDTVPDVDDVVETIREHEAHPAIFILASEAKVAPSARALGCTFLKAPFLPADFAAIVERRLDQVWPGF